MPTLSIIIDWYGPWNSAADASAGAVDLNLSESLYLASGKRERQNLETLQYVGITKNPAKRLLNHHKLGQVRKGTLKLWWGEISSHALSGRPGKKVYVRHSTALNIAEHTTAYFLALRLNDRLRAKPPNRSVVIYNRWFNKDGVRRSHRGGDGWPDLIEFDREGAEDAALRVWFGSQGKRDRLSEKQIKDLASE